MAKPTAKEVNEVQLGFQLPPPVYSDHLTTQPYLSNKNVRLVKSLVLEGDTLTIEAVEGQTYNVPVSNIKYWK